MAKSNIVLDVKPWDDETGKNNIYKYCQDDKNSKQFHFLWPQIVDKWIQPISQIKFSNSMYLLFLAN